MEATKKTSFVAGAIITLSNGAVEVLSLPWLINALIFFPVMLFLVIGTEIHREYKRGIHISNSFIVGPVDAEGWRIYGRCVLRMLIWFLGAVLTAILVGVVNGI